jgi:prepilin-type N-terminal cleavage/methylation domain-containing protein
MGIANKNSSTRGFSLIELLISMAVGLIVVGAAVQLYSSAMDATWVVKQRAETQQDLRAAEDMLLRDVSLAGAGLTGVTGENIPLPYTLGTPKIGCSAGPVCTPNALSYPCIVNATCSSSNPPVLYPIMPGYQKGITPPGGVVATDAITIVYTDTNFPLQCYSGAATVNPITFNATGNQLTFMAPPVTTACSTSYPPALNNPINGLQPGDIVMIGPSGTLTVVGEVTSVSPANPSNTAATPCSGSPCSGGSTYTVNFANGDTLNLNQAGDANDLTTIKGASAGVPITRIFVITYYLANRTDAGGQTTTILYRQVNGQPAVPLVDNIANLQFTYDTYDSDGDLLNATGDGGESSSISPNLIRKVNLAHFTIHSQLYGVRGGYMTKGFQSFDVQTSMSTRNMSYNNRY